MYVPPAFREDDPAVLHALMHEVRLASLVTMTADGLIASPLPLHLVPDEGPLGTLYGHLAKANIQGTLAPIGQALVIFSGADAYVSPSFYPSKAESGKVVPTWNYVVVHAYGTVEFFTDTARLRPLLDRLTARHEAGSPSPWTLDDAPAEYIAAQMKGIIGLRIEISRLDGKCKLSQNRSAADQAGVAAGLAASERPGDRDISERMTKTG
ncbi:FMN-binding negative transcriptional regulator [Oryzibacter oryziterrae]|uniref:FMN-binding negative transcriptional regulator n=1 Tax=Oryzibacter oryziterrae TaxID=2766474 RepID=UPI001F1FE489|nr:FMN-binding negative transcriptional regulator [Oryzibacter oryziterrae]